jgi:hypothetical protein
MVGTNSSHSNVWQQEHNTVTTVTTPPPRTPEPTDRLSMRSNTSAVHVATARSHRVCQVTVGLRKQNCRTAAQKTPRVPDCSGSLDPVAGPMPCNVERTQAPPRTQGHCLHRATKNHGAWRQNPTYHGVVRTAPWNVSHRPLSTTPNVETAAPFPNPLNATHCIDCCGCGCRCGGASPSRTEEDVPW